MPPLKYFSRYYETVRHLRLEQIFFLLVKPLRKKSALYYFSQKVAAPKPASLTLQSFLPSENSVSGNTFTFLNREKIFAEGKIDWNFNEYGLLWNYHLNYFDFLNQENLNREEGLKLIHHFIAHADVRSPSHDPYPVSLRGMNWIKFILKNNIDDTKINESLFRQYRKLNHETEKHLYANHLLENGFSLLFAAYHFQSKQFLKPANQILSRELKEQILDDGAHFELSTLYHRILLNRVLDCINLLQNNNALDDSIQNLLREKASNMLSWLNNMTLRNGIMPDFNDSNISGVNVKQLNAYGKQLGVHPGNLPLSGSGYRKFFFPKYECILDAGNIMPVYNPGHTHADMLTFCLNINDKPVVVDCGTSTYENNLKRSYERSTAAHNTVSVNGLNQSEVWASFRVGRRARIMETSSEKNSFSATLKGFTSSGIVHRREWKFSEDKISIIDSVPGQHSCKAFLHFHPSLNLKHSADSVSGDHFSITFNNHREVALQDYDFAESFNKTLRAKVAVILFSGRLNTEITL